MKLSKLFPFACCALTVILASCGGAPPRALPGAMPESISHIDGNQAKQDLLYVSNNNDEVTVYDYSSQKLVGILTDFTQPRGECVDGRGNVYITDTSAERVLEFAHGGKKPIEKYDDSPDSPYACAIDPTTGDLAVANDDGSSGNIAIWSNGTSQRTTYTDSELGKFQGCAYDTNGDLFVTNGYVGYNNPTLFAWLPEHGMKLINVNVPGPSASWTWYYIGGIQWDGKFFALDDGETIYRVTLIHGQVYYVGSTDVYYGGGQFAFYSAKPGSQANVVVGPSDSDSSSTVDYWSYPAGGEPITEISHAVDDPVAAVISRGKKT
ncbi:MAG: hypothetical protein WB687_05100 [Candidatus Cybelea sp.]